MNKKTRRIECGFSSDMQCYYPIFKIDNNLRTVFDDDKYDLYNIDCTKLILQRGDKKYISFINPCPVPIFNQ